MGLTNLCTINTIFDFQARKTLTANILLNRAKPLRKSETMHEKKKIPEAFCWYKRCFLLKKTKVRNRDSQTLVLICLCKAGDVLHENGQSWFLRGGYELLVLILILVAAGGKTFSQLWLANADLNKRHITKWHHSFSFIQSI